QGWVPPRQGQFDGTLPIRLQESTPMRTRIGLSVVGAVALGCVADASAQGYYSRPYSFKDEPVMSINNSYLGYGNFVYPAPEPPAHANPPGWGGATAPRYYVQRPAPVYYVQRPAQVYAQQPAAANVQRPASAPTRRWMRWDGWRWVYIN